MLISIIDSLLAATEELICKDIHTFSFKIDMIATDAYAGMQ